MIKGVLRGGRAHHTGVEDGRAWGVRLWVENAHTYVSEAVGDLVNPCGKTKCKPICTQVVLSVSSQIITFVYKNMNTEKCVYELLSLRRLGAR